jgi:hypothetical protein
MPGKYGNNHLYPNHVLDHEDKSLLAPFFWIHKKLGALYAPECQYEDEYQMLELKVTLQE